MQEMWWYVRAQLQQLEKKDGELVREGGREGVREEGREGGSEGMRE